MISRDKEAKLLHESQWFGESCYQLLLDMSKGMDIYIYDNARMWCYEEAETLTGQIHDVLRNTTIDLCGGGEWFNYMEKVRS